MIRRLARGFAVGAAIGLAFGAVFWIGGSASASTPDVCAALDSGKVDTTGDPSSVTVTAPAGSLIAGYCVKAGSRKSGAGTEYVELEEPVAELVIAHSSGKAVSHYSLDYVPVVEPSPSETPTKPEPTPTTSEPDPEPTPTATESDPPAKPEPTESGGSVSDDRPAGTKPPAKADELPRTGADWQLVALGAALIAAGCALAVVGRRP